MRFSRTEGSSTLTADARAHGDHRSCRILLLSRADLGCFRDGMVRT